MEVVPVYIALLRAINVGGRNRVPMSALAQLARDLGFQDVVTWLQSGNLVFRSPAVSRGQLETTLETELNRRLAVSTSFVLRTAAEWRDVIEENPFPQQARDDPARLHAWILKGTPNAAAARSLEKAIRGPESIRVAGNCAYVYYPEGAGHSRVTAPLLDRHFGTPGTGRNWNTVLRLGELSSV
ncbi:MAG: DUF1697 domain-containing protein [Thermoplasmata archaeon]